MFHRRPVEAAFAAGKRPVRRKMTHRGSGARGQQSGIFYFVFIFKFSSFRCSPRPYAHLCAGARAAVGPRAKRCERRGGRPGGAASAGGGFGPIHVTAGLYVICPRSWFVMNICMSHNVGMAVIYVTPIIRKCSIFSPKSEPEWPLQENGALAPHFAFFQAVDAPAGRPEHTEASGVMPWLISDA